MRRTPAARAALAAIAATLLAALAASAADLTPEAVKAWDDYVSARERRIEAELESTEGFLAMDFQNPQAAAAERRSVLAGEVSVRGMAAGAGATSGTSVQVPGGEIHHLRGAVFIPGVPYEFTVHRAEHPEDGDGLQEDVLDSRVLWREGGRYRLFLKLERTQVVTVVYNTEHDVRVRRLDDDRLAIFSVSAKIAEVERLAGGREREKPEGRDRGFLWRMNSYWRYRRVPGGVLVECESITMSRPVPGLLERMARPMVENIAATAMGRTMRSLRDRLGKAYADMLPRKP
ncbi:MAG: hypothetical protein LBT74_09505 [Acidobacteriota bacterium]|nr:hypothetical protein [Acidobacteriota bacterium]